MLFFFFFIFLVVGFLLLLFCLDLLETGKDQKWRFWLSNTYLSTYLPWSLVTVQVLFEKWCFSDYLSPNCMMVNLKKQKIKSTTQRWQGLTCPPQQRDNRIKMIHNQDCTNN